MAGEYQIEWEGFRPRISWKQPEEVIPGEQSFRQWGERIRKAASPYGMDEPSIFEPGGRGYPQLRESLPGLKKPGIEFDWSAGGRGYPGLRLRGVEYEAPPKAPPIAQPPGQFVGPPEPSADGKPDFSDVVSGASSTAGVKVGAPASERTANAGYRPTSGTATYDPRLTRGAGFGRTWRRPEEALAAGGPPAGGVVIGGGGAGLDWKDPKVWEDRVANPTAFGGYREAVERQLMERAATQRPASPIEIEADLRAKLNSLESRRRQLQAALQDPSLPPDRKTAIAQGLAEIERDIDISYQTRGYKSPREGISLGEP